MVVCFTFYIIDIKRNTCSCKFSAAGTSVSSDGTILPMYLPGIAIYRKEGKEMQVNEEEVITEEEHYIKWNNPTATGAFRP